MEASELIAAFRQRADDRAEPYLFEDDDILRWASEAEREACLRAKLIFDRTKPSVCIIPLLPGVTMYPLNPLIIEVASVRLDRTLQLPGWKLHELTNVDQSSAIGGRRCRDYGNLIGLVDEFRIGPHLRLYSIDGNTLQVYGTPDTSYAGPPGSVLRLEVYRLPLDSMESPSDEPEIPLMHQDGLIDWMLYRAFSTTDADQMDNARASAAEQRFEVRFGSRPSARAVRMQAEGRRWTTRYGGLR